VSRPPIVWLASYPKCGNTWVRFMLSAAVFGVPERSSEVPARIPDIHQRDRWSESEETGNIAAPYRFIKTHFKLTDAHPLLDETSRAIHIIRDPRDVIHSALNYRALTGQGQRTWTQRGYTRSFIRAGGDKHWHKVGFGSWADNAASWRATDRFPVLGVRYEDLKAEPAAQLERMMSFLEIPIDAQRLGDAVEASRFESMRAMEVREKKATQSGENGMFIGDKAAARKGLLFVNKGRSGQSLDSIGKGLDARLTMRMGDAMRAYGYA